MKFNTVFILYIMVTFSDQRDDKAGFAWGLAYLVNENSLYERSVLRFYSEIHSLASCFKRAKTAMDEIISSRLHKPVNEVMVARSIFSTQWAEITKVTVIHLLGVP